MHANALRIGRIDDRRRGVSTPAFSAHNIRLDDGTLTKPELPHPISAEPWLVSAKRVLATAFPGDKS